MSYSANSSVFTGHHLHLAVLSAVQPMHTQTHIVDVNAEIVLEAKDGNYQLSSIYPTVIVMTHSPVFQRLFLALETGAGKQAPETMTHFAGK